MRISEPQELLGYLPYHLGFQPEESVVALSVRGQRRRVGLVMRIDIADFLHPEGRDLLRLHMEEDGAQEVLLVAYTNASFTSAPKKSPVTDAPKKSPTTSATEKSRPQASVSQLRELLVNLEAEFGADLPLMGLWVVTPEHYFSITDGAIPPRDEWDSTQKLENTAAAATAIYAGSMVAESREALAELPRASNKDRDRAQRATLRWLERQRTDGTGTWQLETWQHWEDALKQQVVRAADSQPAAPLTASVLGRLQAGLEDIRLRDAVMISALPEMGDLPYRSVATDAREEIARSVDHVLDPGRAVRPGVEAKALKTLLTAILAHCANSRSTPALTLLSWIAWWEGNGARASVLINKALEINPSYNMARLIERMIEMGMPPGWAQRQRELEEVG